MFGFGSNTATTTSSTFGSGGLFGSTSTASGFGSGGLFGAKSTANPFSTQSSLFGTPASSTTTFGTGGGLFGSTPATTSQSLFGAGTLFGAKTTASSLFTGGFGTATTSSSLFGSTSSTGMFNLGGTFGQPQPAAQQINQTSALNAALQSPQLFNDERNAIIAKWNQLQAYWGTGQGHYSPSLPPVNFSTDNIFCRFKAVCYSQLPLCKDEDGLISLHFTKKAADVVAQKQQLIDVLYEKVLKKNQLVTVHVDSVKPVTEDSCEVIIYVIEKLPPMGVERRITATKLNQFLLQDVQTRELTGMGITNFRANKAISDVELKLYLNTPPSGMHPLLWQQAVADNPDPQRLVPVSLCGAKQLHQRFMQQQLMSQQQRNRVDVLRKQVQDIRQKHSVAKVKVSDARASILSLAHRVLKVISNHEILRKRGYPLQPNEKEMRCQLEAILLQLSAPNQCKSRLNELVSQLRLQNNNISSQRFHAQYKIETTSQENIKDFLQQQQKGIAQIISQMKQNLQAVTIMEAGLQQHSESIMS